MLIIVSPTKTMKENIVGTEEPLFFANISKAIMKELQKLKEEDIKTLMKVNDKIAELNFNRYHNFKFDDQGTKAIEAYQGLQYQYMDIDTLDKKGKKFADKHLRILSGLYGVLKPNHVVYPYRLEMQAKLSVNGHKDLYDLWKETISDHLIKELDNHKEPIILNLASNEYSKVLNKHCKKYMITIQLKIEKNGKIKTESTQAKMARGRMVSYLLRNRVETLDALKKFQEDGYQFEESLSNEHEYVFVKREK